MEILSRGCEEKLKYLLENMNEYTNMVGRADPVTGKVDYNVYFIFGFDVDFKGIDIDDFIYLKQQEYISYDQSENPRHIENIKVLHKGLTYFERKSYEKKTMIKKIIISNAISFIFGVLLSLIIK